MMSQFNADNMAVLKNAISTDREKTTKRTKPQLMRYRLMIVYRFILAGVGGYVLSVLAAIVIAQVFSEHQSSAAMTAILVAFTLQTCAFIWVFMVHKTYKASLGIMLPIIVFSIIYKVLGN